MSDFNDCLQQLKSGFGLNFAKPPCNVGISKWISLFVCVDCVKTRIASGPECVFDSQGTSLDSSTQSHHFL